MFRTTGLFLLLCSITATSFSQDTTDMLRSLDTKNETNYTIATFKATRLVNGHTVQNLGKGVLDVRISHRFGRLNTGIDELFGLDNATARIGLDYGLTNALMIGAGRNSFEKTLDGFVKWRILRQSTGAKKFPFTVSYAGGIYRTTQKMPLNDNYKGLYRMAYMNQLLIGRKFSTNTSFQIAPTHLHRNLVPRVGDPNDLFAIGLAGRQKLTRRVSITAEYYYLLESAKIAGTVSPLSIGFDIETGGHVFQLHFTNSQAINERGFLTGTLGKWEDGDVHFGFNISRVFTLGAYR